MKLGIVVSCATYHDPDIAQLKFADEDAADVCELLKASCDFDDQELVRLSSDAQDRRLVSTRPNILRELNRYADAATQQPMLDLVVFFYSGHGVRSTTGTRDLLVPVDAAANDIEETSITFERILGLLERLAARTTLVVLDACRATVEGGKSGVSSNWAPIEVANLHASGMAVFSSCAPGERSYESDRLQNGLFTFAVCEALGDIGKARTVYELDNYLATRLPMLSKEYARPLQHPYTRVEPLGVQSRVLVAPHVLAAWQSAAPMGKELRPRGTYPPPPAIGPGELMGALDFGTTLSALGVLAADGSVRLVPSPTGRALVVSALAFQPSLDYVVGATALEPTRGLAGPPIRHVKRRLGTTEMYNVAGRSFSPEFVASLIIRSLVRNAEEWLGRSISRVLAAVPANFSIVQCNALARACELAGLHLVRLVGEPSAASVTLARPGSGSVEADKQVLVIDLGGGTLDVCLLSIGEGVHEVRSVAGDNDLGGVDFDQHLYTYVVAELSNQVQLDTWLSDELNVLALMAECERAKHALGRSESTEVVLDKFEDDYGNLRTLSVTLDRARYAEITGDLTDRFSACITHALQNPRWQDFAPVDPSKVDTVLLAGQASKLFTIREAITRLLPSSTIVDTFQESAVVTGLCLYSGMLTGRRGFDGLLLLNALARAIAVSYVAGSGRVNPERNRTHPPGVLASDIPARIATLSRHDAANDGYLPIVEQSSTIPTTVSVLLEIKGGSGDRVILHIVEINNLSNEPLDLGAIQVEDCAEDLTLIVQTEVDANGTMVLEVWHPIKRYVLSYQLNNFFAPVQSSGASRVRRGVAYQARPIERIPSPLASSAEVGGPAEAA